jgi:ubiquinone/menaquinone biosynthesis C-methylase UbiE
MRLVKLAATFMIVSNALCAQHKCGNDYFNSHKRLEKLKPTFDALAFQAGDTIASIGTSNGWFEAALSAYYNDLTFYIEDIDSFCLNRQNLDNQLNLYSSMKASQITNKFFLVHGTDSSTNLPKNKFKKILLNDVFHHFTSKKRMLQELFAIALPSGELLVIEPIGTPTNKCNYYRTPEKLIAEFKSGGFAFMNKQEIMSGTFLFRFKK